MIVERSSYRSGDLTERTRVQRTLKLRFSDTLGRESDVELVLY
jgi:hypothetical protein